MRIRTKFSKGLNETIIRRGYSRRAFAKRVGIGEATIIQICNGTRNPSPSTAKRIVEALEVEWDDIFEIVKEQKVVQ